MRGAAIVLALTPLVAVASDEPAPIGYASVAATLAAVRALPGVEFREQRGWIIAAARERGNPVQWFFTPAGHSAHPAVVKRTAIERDGTGLIDLAALCQTPQVACDALLDDFRQQHEREVLAARPERVELDVRIAFDDRERVHVKRLRAEEGLAAEIRLDELLKMVLVPTVDERGSVLLWTAVYEFDGTDFALLGQPRFASPGNGVATLELTSAAGVRYGLSLASLVAEAEQGEE